MDNSLARVDFFKPDGNWAYTEMIEWPTWAALPEDPQNKVRRGHWLQIHDAFYEALTKAGLHRGMMMTAMCLEPFHEMACPVMLVDWDNYPERSAGRAKEPDKRMYYTRLVVAKQGAYRPEDHRYCLRDDRPFQESGRIKQSQEA